MPLIPKFEHGRATTKTEEARAEASLIRRMQEGLRNAHVDRRTAPAEPAPDPATVLEHALAAGRGDLYDRLKDEDLLDSDGERVMAAWARAASAWRRALGRWHPTPPLSARERETLGKLLAHQIGVELNNLVEDAEAERAALQNRTAAFLADWARRRKPATTVDPEVADMLYGEDVAVEPHIKVVPDGEIGGIPAYRVEYPTPQESNR